MSDVWKLVEPLSLLNRELSNQLNAIKTKLDEIRHLKMLSHRLKRQSSELEGVSLPSELLDILSRGMSLSSGLLNALTFDLEEVSRSPEVGNVCLSSKLEEILSSKLQAFERVVCMRAEHLRGECLLLSELKCTVGFPS